jgi:hypothetical protein
MTIAIAMSFQDIVSGRLIERSARGDREPALGLLGADACLS